MISLIVNVTAKDGQGAALEAAFRELAARVKANEPGCLTYELIRDREAPGAYTIVEFYRDDAALEAHRNSAHFKALSPALGATFAGAARKLFDVVE
jgi:quinol monooxygenase YgiN